MIRGLFVALLGLGLLGSTLTAQPPKGKDAPPKDGKGAKEKMPPKEKPAPVIKDIAGMFKSKDLDKKTLTLTVDGKERTFRIAENTKFTGPRGGVRDDKLKDEVLALGYKIIITPNAKEDGPAVEVKLPFRTARETVK
jgi:hypothetical protein